MGRTHGQGLGLFTRNTLIHVGDRLQVQGSGHGLGAECSQMDKQTNTEKLRHFPPAGSVLDTVLANKLQSHSAFRILLFSLSPPSPAVLLAPASYLLVLSPWWFSALLCVCVVLHTTLHFARLGVEGLISGLQLQTPPNSSYTT